VRGNVTLNCSGIDPDLVRALNEQFKDQLRQRDLRIEQVTREANAWIAAMSANACSKVTADLLAYSVQAQNASQTLKYLRCNPEFVVTYAVLSRMADLFKASGFTHSRDFREALRAAGIRFLHDFGPAYSGDALGESPLVAAAKSYCIECVDWLLAGQDRDAVRTMPTSFGTWFTAPAQLRTPSR
jgi:hypothetical protein